MRQRAVPVPPALRERLGEEASRELGEMVSTLGRAWMDDVLEFATERFGRMLAEEAGRIRVEMANFRVELKQEIGALKSELKDEIGAAKSELKGEIGAFRNELKEETTGVRTSLRGEIIAAETRLRTELIERIGALRVDMVAAASRMQTDTLKWAFAFWIGQVVVMVAILSFMLRGVR